jgi:probable phosphomutase (TIGR03848 family)
VTDTVADAAAPDQAASETASADPETTDTEARKPPPATMLLLARHAVTAETGSMLSGRKPGIDLSDKGREQAASLGERLAGLPIAAVYASPIERTMQTAEAVAVKHGLEVRELPGVLEADYGEWTGGKLGDLAKEDLWRTVQRAPSRARFPDGESLAEMQVRMVATLERVVADHPGETVVVVSHADPIKSAIAHYNGTHLDLFQRIVVSPASVTAFQLSAHGAAMLKCNDTGSLEELIPRPAEDAPDGESAEGSAGTPSGGAAGEASAGDGDGDGPEGTAAEGTAGAQAKGAAQA